ncbi:unnamed protein product, partial [Discosporangium mesarthrocarpum]
LRRLKWTRRIISRQTGHPRGCWCSRAAGTLHVSHGACLFLFFLFKGSTVFVVGARRDLFWTSFLDLCFLPSLFHLKWMLWAKTRDGCAPRIQEVMLWFQLFKPKIAGS